MGTVQDLSARLWHERELLDLLTFKLEEEQLLLTAGRTRWISHATREVEQVLERLRRRAWSARRCRGSGGPGVVPLRTRRCATSWPAPPMARGPTPLWRTLPR